MNNTWLSAMQWQRICRRVAVYFPEAGERQPVPAQMNKFVCCLPVRIVFVIFLHTDCVLFIC